MGAETIWLGGILALAGIIAVVRWLRAPASLDLNDLGVVSGQWIAAKCRSQSDELP